MAATEPTEVLPPPEPRCKQRESLSLTFRLVAGLIVPLALGFATLALLSGGNHLVSVGYSSVYIAPFLIAQTVYGIFVRKLDKLTYFALACALPLIAILFETFLMSLLALVAMNDWR
jgi:hypothetical protein